MAGERRREGEDEVDPKRLDRVTAALDFAREDLTPEQRELLEEAELDALMEIVFDEEVPRTAERVLEQGAVKAKVRKNFEGYFKAGKDD